MVSALALPTSVPFLFYYLCSRVSQMSVCSVEGGVGSGHQVIATP